jgi:hypothetical protein
MGTEGISGSPKLCKQMATLYGILWTTCICCYLVWHEFLSPVLFVGVPVSIRGQFIL